MTRITATLPGVFMDNALFGDGWQLQTVEGLWGATDPRLDNEAREWGHGDLGQAEAFQAARYVTLAGVFQSRADPDAILAADGVLTQLLNLEEFPLTLTGGPISGTMQVRLAARVGWDVDHAPGAAQFEATFKADDPRIYGAPQSGSTGVPTPGVGVADPLLDPFQVGTLAEVGRNLFTNPNLVGGGTWAEVARFPTGSTPPVVVQPEDFRVRDLGTGESVMEIERVRGLASNNCVAGVSTKGGKPAVRLISTGANASFASFPIPPLAHSSGTMLGTVHLDAAISGALSARFAALSAENPVTFTAPDPNTPGSRSKRLSFGPLTNFYQVRWYHGGSVGSGDVWWTDVGLFAGNYDGPAVSGDSPASGDLVYVWAGQRDNSETIIYQVDASAEGNLGRVSVVNGGNAPTEPTVTVTGGLSGGFELLCIETGRVVRVTRPIPDGSQISIAMGSGEIWIDGQSPVPAQFTPVTEWMHIAPGATCTFQFTPLGVVTGTPTMTVEWAEASW